MKLGEIAVFLAVLTRESTNFHKQSKQPTTYQLLGTVLLIRNWTKDQTQQISKKHKIYLSLTMFEKYGEWIQKQLFTGVL